MRNGDLPGYFEVMGDPTAGEDIRRHDDSITLCPNATETINGLNLSVSPKTQNKLMLRGNMDWPAKKQQMINNEPEEKPENTAIRLCLDSSVSGNSAPGPSPAFLTALTSLSEHTDHMLLPQSLHQIAEAYFLEEDYQWAVQFLQLEILYHERLLSNLASMHKDWESQWKSLTRGNKCPVKAHCTEIETKCMNSLNHICRTHQRFTKPTRDSLNSGFHMRPNHSVMEEVTKESITVQQMITGRSSKMREWTEQPESDPEEETGDEDEDREEDLEVQEEVEGRQELSEDVLTELIEVEETFPSNGLVSILKKREESSPVSLSPHRNSSKYKVRFRDPDALLDNDDVGEDSCLFFLVLCLVTVVISMGGTMIYCILGGAYSSICADFSHNTDFFLGFVRRAVDSLTHWFIPASS